MFKRLLLLLLLSSFLLNAQDSLFVKLGPNNTYNRLMLYKITGVQQAYISNVKSDKDTFKFEFPTNSESGMYRLFFDIQNSGFFEIIYNNESISVEFDPTNANESAVFTKSKENKTYHTYIQTTNNLQITIDSLQVTYFNGFPGDMELDDVGIEKKKLIGERYSKSVTELKEIQLSYEEMSEGLLAHHFIKSNRKYNSDVILETPENYYAAVVSHFFDAVDFGDIALRNSSFFIDKVVEYIFYLNDSEDEETYLTIKQNAINEVAELMGENYDVKSEILSSLMFAFAGQEGIRLVDFIKKEHYEKLPIENQNKQFIEQINEMLKMAIGSPAPEFNLPYSGKIISLSELEGFEYYIIAFWSTSCSHCLSEIPQLYEFSKGLEGIKIIAVALEKTRIDFDAMIKDMPNWIHVLGLNKWENEIARNYNINSTPTYFVLDKDKKFIVKPDGIEDLKFLFEEN